jgi:hypothetical protein
LQSLLGFDRYLFVSLYFYQQVRIFKFDQGLIIFLKWSEKNMMDIGSNIGGYRTTGKTGFTGGILF